ncbi:MAG: GGDEF domain-containing protein [Lachnospiraceae bacterium]|nr:GGDEF domain-containing protein [Lachnospiraceae bacterium]
MEILKREIEELKKKQFETILKDELIRPVYQPIISLQDGEVLGYEALSRITLKDSLLNPEEFFHMAEQMDCLWKTEELCRRKSLQGAVGKKNNIKLFLNVDPNVLKDPQFKEGITCRYLKEYGLQPSDIVFEITERNSIEDEESFRKVILHYRNQKFQIAIDDFGNGYAGMNRICALEPQYIKIDMQIVREIHMDNMKKALVESMIQFCDKSGIRLIAEGIETEEELKTLIKLGVHYGQGYYILRPKPTMEAVSLKIRELIKNVYTNLSLREYQPSFWGNIGDICKRKVITKPEKPAKDLYYYLRERPTITEVTVLNEEEEVLGVITRAELMVAFGGIYGYDLSMRKRACDLMDQEALVVDCNDSVEQVSKVALMRPQRTLYDAVIVTENGHYKGVVTVKELLETAITIQVNRASDSSPLTGLPGNSMIDSMVHRCLSSKKPFAIAYIDMDNFKAYNDAYGFNNGDAMIRALANSMKESCQREEFLGHIGGDDFVVIAEYQNIQPLLENISSRFQEKIVPLYRKEDFQRGYIISKDRHGAVEQFPIVTLSIAVITNQNYDFKGLADFSEHLVKAKKESKAIVGNSCVFNHESFHT